jgi:hypothetical protein
MTSLAVGISPPFSVDYLAVFVPTFSPRAGKDTLSGFVTFIAWPATPSGTNGEAAVG